MATFSVDGQDIGGGSFDVRKIGALVPVSAEMAMDYGVIPDTRTHVPPSRWTRLRWWWSERRYDGRMRVASWVAGFDVTDRD